MAEIQWWFDATATDDIPLGNLNKQPLRPHTQVQMRFEDANRQPVTPSGGTFSISVLLDGATDYELIQTGEDIDATEPIVQRSYAGIAQRFKYAPTGITGAALAKVTLISTES